MRALRTGLVLLATCLALGLPARAEDGKRLRVVATFSILADLAREVGGDAVEVTSLVGPDADAHGYTPSPGDGRRLAQAGIVIVNGLGFEGWLDRLVRASGTKAPVVVASAGVRALSDDAAHGHAHGTDPHAWQSVTNAKIYVANIRDGLAKADPTHAELYAVNAKTYLARLDGLDAEVRAALDAIPAEHRRIITTHDAFGYFADAYGLTFIAPQGVSTDSEASPRDVASLIRQIKRERIPAVFVETITDPRLMEQVSRESGARIGGRIHSDALSGPTGPAPSYIEMMRANAKAFGEALKG